MEGFYQQQHLELKPDLPASAEGNQRFVLGIKSSHSVLNLLAVSNFSLEQTDKREEGGVI